MSLRYVPPTLALLLTAAAFGSCSDSTDTTTPPDTCGADASCCTSVADCPGEDSACSFRSCQAGRCEMELVEPNTPCGNGQVCTGTGECVGGETEWNDVSPDGAPSARSRHSAVWTGTEMIIWGGRNEDGVTQSGGRYDPATDSWTPTTTTGAPTARHSHSAVWTGERMIVWGGFSDDFDNTGALYDPATDTWTAMTTTDAPLGRTRHSTVWTDEEMIVFGGLNDQNNVSGGARYHAENDTWTALPAQGQPSQRQAHAAIWSEPEMFVWGGTNTFDWLDDGVRYDLSVDRWRTRIESDNAPLLRESASTVWTGQAMVVWAGWDGGNYFDGGALYFPGTGWVTMVTAGAPSARAQAPAVWTGSEMIVYGGCVGAGCAEVLDGGGRYVPSADGGSWLPFAENSGLGPRERHTVVWTGDQVIVWGGDNGSAPLGTGARTAL